MKRILSVVLAVVMVVCLVGCGTTYQEATRQTENSSAVDYGNGYFTVITKWENASYICKRKKAEYEGSKH